MSYGQYSNEPKPWPPAKPAKEKKLKAVFDTGEVPHVWAHPAKPTDKLGYREGYLQMHARNPQNNLFFNTASDGTRILYSYRESYPIGSRFVIGKGKSARVVFLIRSGKPYSVTTASHMSAASSASNITGTLRFSVPNVAYGGKPTKDMHNANLADYVERITQAVKAEKNARSKWKLDGARVDYFELVAEAQSYAKTFKLRMPKLPALPPLDATRYERYEASARKRGLAQEEARAEADRIRSLSNAEKSQEWKRGAKIDRWYLPREYALLRVNGSNVETSQGVKVPIMGRAGAARLLRFLKATHNAGRPYKANGHTEHIGNFTVQSFGPSKEVLEARAGLIPENDVSDWIIVAGCHRILWSEVLTIAPEVEAYAASHSESAEQGGEYGGGPVE